MSATAAAQLIFNWDRPARRNFILGTFIVASFAIHVVAFYLFQVVYPQTVSLVPAPRRINLMTASSEQTATLLRWIDAEDPALASTTRRPPHLQRREMGKVEHVPSYFAREPGLKPVPPLTVDLQIPSAQPPGPVPVKRSPVAAPAGVQPTRVTFSNELQQLGPAKFASENFKATANQTPQNAQFRIAVDPAGAVIYCLPLISSGDANLDELARQNLALCRFPARPATNPDSLMWGIATIEWGNDIAAADAKPKASTP